jgi:hypothetical protein
MHPQRLLAKLVDRDHKHLRWVTSVNVVEFAM